MAIFAYLFRSSFLTEQFSVNQKLIYKLRNGLDSLFYYCFYCTTVLFNNSFLKNYSKGEKE